ncbi:MAG: IS66 family transposase, partial [Coriobacteriales bacterium]|nr:IS66 family transposase [Coriobacteriales bacterium]
MGDMLGTYDAGALLARVAELEGEVAVLSRDNAQLSSRAASAERDAAASEARAQGWRRAHETLKAEHEALERDYAALKGRYDEAQARLGRIVEQMRLAARRQWGPSSEACRGQLPLLLNDAEGFADATLPEAAPGRGKGKRGKRQRRVDWDAYETEVVEHDLADGDKSCPACGSALVPMGYDVTRELVFVPARVKVVEHRTMKYVCPSCSAANQADGGETPAVVVRAEAPEGPLAGSWASASLVAHCVHQKFALGQPIYRLADDLGRQCALPVTRQTVGSWVTRATERWLSLVRDAMAEWLRGREVLHVDETGVRVLKEPNRKGGLGRDCYVWLFAAAAADDHPCYVFEYGPGRGSDVPVRFLGAGWSGTVVTDAYDGYNEIVRLGARRMSCLVHIRREFLRVVDAAGGRGRCPGDAVSAQAVERINLMFALDSLLDGRSPEERRRGRNEATAIDFGGRTLTTSLAEQMGSFERFCRDRLPEAAPRSLLANALANALEQWPHVGSALVDGRVPLDNNLAERAIRPWCVGRRNWLFCDTPSGAAASCAAYSVVTTARACGLDDRRYVEWLLAE